MRRVLFACILASLAMSWPVAKFERSIGRLKIEDGRCTAFSIHAKEARWITATHCFTDEKFEGAIVNDLAKVVKILETVPGDANLTVFQTDLRFEKQGQYPALKLGPLPAKGDDVLVLGFAGSSPLLFWEGLFIVNTTEVDGDRVQVISAPGTKGMSGGPILDRKGRVVGVMIGGAMPTPPVPTLVSFSPLYDQLAALMAKYGEK